MKKLSIYLMLAVAGLFMTACGPEDNEFASPKTASADDVVILPGFTAGQLGTIDLNTVEVSAEQDVQAFTLTSDALPEGVTLSKSEIEFLDGTVLTATGDGKVSGVALSEYITSLFGPRPELRTTEGRVFVYAVQNGAAVKLYAGQITFLVVPKAPVIATKYYLTGTMNGWDNSNTDYELTNDGTDPYENSTFTCTLKMADLGNPTSIEFKATPIDGLGGDWSGCLAAADEEGKFNYNNEGGNFKIENIAADTKVIALTFNMLDQTWSYKEIAFDSFVYFIGATDGWSTPDQKLALTDETNGIYTGYLYIADPNGWGIAFKFQKTAGNWDTQINVDAVTLSGDFIDNGNGDRNIVANQEGVYFVELNLSANTLKGTLITKMGIIGGFNGWGSDVEMTWNATDFCYEATGAGVTADGWKFRINGGWDINLGSNDSTEPSTVLTDLVANGKNIGVAGNTIKLYPTRKTSEKIYCTVE